MYIEFIWRNSQKKFKLIPTNNIPEKFQNLKKSYDSFEYTFDSKVYFHYVTKTIFLNLWEKNITKKKKRWGIKEYKKNGPPNSAGDVIGLGDPINTAYAFLTPYPATAAPGHMTSEAGINYELDRSKDPKSASLYTASAANTSTQHLKFEQHGKQGSVLEQVGNEVVVQPNLENALSIEDQAARWIWQDKNRMNRHVAEKVLSAKKVGTYLVRAGTLTPWVLSVKESEGNINHVRIYEKHGLFFLGLGTRDETSVEGHEALSSQSQSESITILIDKIKEKKGLIAPLEDTSRERS